LLALEQPGVRTVLTVDEAGGVVPPAVGDVALEHVGRLDDVVVDADQDEILGAHGRILTPFGAGLPLERRPGASASGLRLSSPEKMTRRASFRSSVGAL